MELTADEIIQKYRKQCQHCNRNTLLPYAYEYTCFSNGFNLIKRKHELCRIQQKKINFINRLKHAEQKIICICIDVYKIYEGNDFVKIYEVLSFLKNRKLKTNNILYEKYKDTFANPEFEQNYWSKTAEGVYEVGQDSIRLMKWLIY